MLEKITIATRGSKLALWQAEHVAGLLGQLKKDLEVDFKIVRTSGDKILDVSLAKVGGKGLFVKEIEETIQNEEADLAVHSLKDVPAELPDGLKLGVFPERDDPSDSLLSNYYSDLSSLPKNSSIGTSSLRRQAQLLALRPDLKIYPLRGNLDTRVKKLERGDFDAIVVASVGLKRLKIQAKQNYKFPLESFLPAIGQGALGIEYLEENIALDTMLQKINHLDTKVAILAERSFLHELEGGCQVPIAGYAEIIEENKLIMRGLVADIYGTKIVKREACSDLDKAKDLGRNLAREVLKSGGDEILKEIYT